jgi:hypothetical protein
MGSMYASVIFMGVQNSGSVQPVVSVERTVFYRERAAHMYSPLPYALGQVKFIAIHYIQQPLQNLCQKKESSRDNNQMQECIHSLITISKITFFINNNQ